METCIVRGLFEKDRINSRWLVSKNALYYTALIPNKELPVIGEVIQVKKLEDHCPKHLKKEIVPVSVKRQIQKGQKNSRWLVSYNGIDHTCLLSNFLAVKPKGMVLIEMGKLKRIK